MEGRIFVDEEPTTAVNATWGHRSLLEGYVETPCQQDDKDAGYFEVFASTAGTGIGVTNLVVILVILLGGRKLHKATFYCICNLAVADMLTGLLLLWIFGLQKVLLPFRTPTSELVQKSVWSATVWSSLLSQLVIALDRYCYVTKGSKGDGGVVSGTRQGNKWGNQKRKRLIKSGIAMTWVLPTVCFVIPVMTSWNCVDTCLCQTPLNSSGVYYMVCTPVQQCSQTNPPFTKGSMLYLGLSLLLMPIIPCVLYARIYHFVSLSTKKFKPSVYAPAAHHGNPACLAPKPTVLPPNGRTDHQIKAEASPFILPPSKPRVPAKTSWRKNLNRKLGREGRTNSSAASVKSSVTLAMKRCRDRDMKLLRTLIMILALFLVSTVPLGLLFIASYTEVDKSFVQTVKVLLTTSLLNSLVNPWVYFWRFPEMRSGVRRVLCRCFPRTYSRATSDGQGSADRRRNADSRVGHTGPLSDTAFRAARNIKKPDGGAKEATSSSASGL